jgi:hypothetical protein
MPCIQHVLVRSESRERDLILLHPTIFCSGMDTKALVLFHFRYALMPSLFSHEDYCEHKFSSELLQHCYQAASISYPVLNFVSFMKYIKHPSSVGTFYYYELTRLTNAPDKRLRARAHQRNWKLQCNSNFREK